MWSVDQVGLGTPSTQSLAMDRVSPNWRAGLPDEKEEEEEGNGESESFLSFPP